MAYVFGEIRNAGLDGMVVGCAFDENGFLKEQQSTQALWDNRHRGVLQSLERLNRLTGDAFQSRTVFIHGKGLGSQFKGVSASSEAIGFPEKMRSLCANYAYNFKYFDAGFPADKSLEGWRDHLENYCHFKEVAELGVPLVFVGDAGDGLRAHAFERNVYGKSGPYALRAVRDAFRERGWTGFSFGVFFAEGRKLGRTHLYEVADGEAIPAPEQLRSWTTWRDTVVAGLPAPPALAVPEPATPAPIATAAQAAKLAADKAFNAARDKHKHEPDYQKLHDEFKSLNGRLRDMQQAAGIKDGIDAGAREAVMKKLKRDAVYRKVEQQRDAQREALRDLLMVKDPAFKDAEARYRKLAAPAAKRPGNQKLPKTQTKCQTYPRRAVFAEHEPVFDEPTTLWFRYPAQSWLEAFPIGNGSFGAMVFGGLTKDVVQFNHDTLWTPPDISAEAVTAKYPDRRKDIDEIRQLLFAGKGYEAHKIVNERIQKKYDVGSYQPFAELHFEYDFGSELKAGQVGGYTRKLNMREGVASTQFSIGKTSYRREVLVAHDKSVIGVRFSADGHIGFSSKITLSRPAHFPHQEAERVSVGGNRIAILGKAYGKDVSPFATSFEAIAEVSVEGGSVESRDGVLTVSDARQMTVLLAGATNYNVDDPFTPLAIDLREHCGRLLGDVSARGWEKSRSQATRAHREIFDRVAIRLGEAQKNNMPVDVRVRRSRELPEGQYDHYLTSQLFQMGRYLLITSSQPGALWVNLRGIWNSELRPSWNSDYHHDINIEMSYWAAEVTNMTECHLPLFDSLKILGKRGRRVASEMLGCRGTFVPLCHGGYLTAYPPMPPRSMWAMGGPWDATHIMEHYRFGGDKEYLEREGHPLIKEFVLFCLDWLVEDPRTGKLVAGPDYSPETAYAVDEEHRKRKHWGSEDMGCAMDQQIIWQLFTDFLEASDVLGYADDLTKEVEQKRAQLATTRVGADGTIMEWSQDWISSEPDHRHVSHLWAFYPGNQFHVDNAPDLLEAAKKTLAIRTDSTRGGKRVTWSNCYFICYYARFGMAEKALEWIQNLNLIRGFNMNLMGSQGQVQDCNYGYPAAVAEMLLQSHTGEIKLLPALPEAWAEGEVTGLVARGGFEIAMKWDGGTLTEASVLSKRGSPCVVRYQDRRVQLELGKGQMLNLQKALGLKE